MLHFRPRDYQQEALEATLKYIKSGGKAGLICLPTGTGKSCIPAITLKALFEDNPYLKAMMLTHRKTLIGQNHKALKSIFPNAPCGIYSAGLKRKESHDQIIYAGIQSVYKKAELFGHMDVIIIDEAHLVSPDGATMYGLFIAALREINPDLVVIGMTATPFRLDSGLLIDGDLFDDIIIDKTLGDDFTWFIDQGYLCEVHSRDVEGRFDTSGVKKSKGEFVIKSLTEKFNRTSVSQKIVNVVKAVRGNRKCGITFAISIEHAEELCEMYNAAGIPAVVAHSKLDDPVVETNIAAFIAGKVEMLIDVERYTTGFDHPNIDLIVGARPTESASLFIQMNGRGTRPVYAAGFDLSTKEGRLAAIAAGPKPNGCLALDFAGNAMRLGPMNAPITGDSKPETSFEGEALAPQKICPACLSYVHAAKTLCECRDELGNLCSHEFPKGEEVTMSGAIVPGVLIRRDNLREDRLFDVVKCFPRKGTTFTGKPYVTVTIIAKGLKDPLTETMYVSDKAYSFARDAWRRLLPDVEYPYVRGESVETNTDLLIETLQDEFNPTKALVWVNRNDGKEIKPYLLEAS